MPEHEHSEPKPEEAGDLSAEQVAREAGMAEMETWSDATGKLAEAKASQNKELEIDEKDYRRTNDEVNADERLDDSERSFNDTIMDSSIRYNREENSKSVIRYNDKGDAIVTPRSMVGQTEFDDKTLIPEADGNYKVLETNKARYDHAYWHNGVYVNQGPATIEGAPVRSPKNIADAEEAARASDEPTPEADAEK
jgi:hypothetical protein